MENQYEQNINQLNQLESDLRYAKEILQKAEKYERLIEEKDFKDFLKDFEEGYSVHSSQIEEALGMLSESSPRKQEDLFRIILIHQSKKETVDALVNRPKHIIELAKKARKEIPELEEKIIRSREELKSYA